MAILVPPDWIPILNPPVAVIIPVVFILAVVEKPRAVVAVVAVPWKVGAVTAPINQYHLHLILLLVYLFQFLGILQ